MKTIGRHSGESRHPEKDAGCRIKDLRHDEKELDTGFSRNDDRGRVVRHSGKAVEPESRKGRMIRQTACSRFTVPGPAD